MSLTKVKAGNILLTTPGASSNDVTPATTQYVTTAISNLVDTAPSTLNTLNELAAALGDDVNFSTTVTNSIATKLPLAGGSLTGALDITASGNQLTLSRSGFDNILFGTGTVNGQVGFHITNSTDSVVPFSMHENAPAASLVFDSSGNVGIGGVTDPDAKLEVKGTSAAPSATAQILSVTNTTGGTRLDLGVAENSSGWIQAREGSTLRDLLLNSDGGNVGIGLDSPSWPLDVSSGSSSVQLQLGRDGSNSGTAWLGADAGGFHLGVGAYGGGNSVASPNGFEVRTNGAIYMPEKAANVPQINIGTQSAATGIEFYPYSSVGSTYSSWDLNLGANISPKIGTTSSGHQIMTAYTASGGSNLRVGFNQLAWQRWTPAELSGKAARAAVSDKDGDPMFQVNTDGHMRAPYSSAFRTYLSTERTTNGLINSGWTDTSSSGVNAYDRAGDFNTSNGRFTAPVDGVYHFDVMWDSNAAQGGLNLHVTGTGHTEYNVRWEPTGRSDDGWESHAYATSVQMDTGDYVELYAVHCTGTHPVHMGSGHWGFFAGHLVS